MVGHMQWYGRPYVRPGARVQGDRNKEVFVTIVNKFSLLVIVFSPAGRYNHIQTETLINFLGVDLVSTCRWALQRKVA